MMPTLTQRSPFRFDRGFSHLSILLFGAVALSSCSQNSSSATGAQQPGGVLSRAAGQEILTTDLAGAPGTFAGRWVSRACFTTIITKVQPCTADFTITQTSNQPNGVLSMTATVVSQDKNKVFSLILPGAVLGPATPAQVNFLYTKPDDKVPMGHIGVNAFTVSLPTTEIFTFKLVNAGTTVAFSDLGRDGSRLDGTAVLYVEPTPADQPTPVPSTVPSSKPSAPPQDE